MRTRGGVTTALAVSLIGTTLAGSPKPPARTLSTDDKKSYLDAVKCILEKPAITPPFNGSGVKSRYDDLVYTHILQTFSIHYVGHFLPWHRYLVAAYENMLRTECGYKGAQPYWDWTLDVVVGADGSNTYAQSPVFDALTGFGGNGPYVEDTSSGGLSVPGRTGGGCVQDGPFAGNDSFVHLGPRDSVTYNPQCLRRDMSPSFATRYLGMNQTRLTLSQSGYGWFSRVVEGGPSFDASGIHGGGHYGVGGTFGQMGDLYASPSDPIFYLHHANLDRVWWSWQSHDLDARLADISGPIFLMDYSNSKGGNVTLDLPMTLHGSGPDLVVRDVMDIRGGGGNGFICYEYDKLY